MCVIHGLFRIILLALYKTLVSFFNLMVETGQYLQAEHHIPLVPLPFVCTLPLLISSQPSTSPASHIRSNSVSASRCCDSISTNGWVFLANDQR